MNKNYPFLFSLLFGLISLVFFSVSSPLLWSQNYTGLTDGPEGSDPSFSFDYNFTGDPTVEDPAQEILLPLEEGAEQRESVEGLPPPRENAQGLFLVRNITYYVSGQTKTWALEHRYHVKERTRFASIADMEAYFRRKEREIKGNSVFSYVKFSYIPEEIPTVSIEESGVLDEKNISPSTPVYDVHLFIQLEEYVTLFFTPPIPRISDDLFKIGIRATDRNIGGSLMNLAVGGDFTFDITGEWHTPIPLWSMSASLSGIYFPGLNMPWSVGAGYNFISEIQNDPNTGERILEYDYHQMNISFGSGIPLLPYFSYNFSFNNTLRFANHYLTDLEGQESAIRKELGIPKSGIGYGLGLSHWFNFSTIADSTRNMRKGYSLWLSNHITYNFNTVTLDAGVNWGGLFFQPFNNDYIEISFRYVGFWNILGVNRSIGYVRGVRDFNISGYLGNYINSTFLFTFWRWVGVWEAQIGFFLDAGVTQRKEGPDSHTLPLSWNNFDIGTGVEGRLHLDIVRGYVIYGRLGIDLKRLPQTTRELLRFWGGKYDFTIGFGLPY